MAATYIQQFREYLTLHPEYREARRDFHEAYELIEGYWQADDRIDSFGAFCIRLGDFYWSLSEIRSLACELACEGPIGNSDNNQFRPTRQVLRATMFLLHHAEIVPDDTLRDREEAVRSRWRGAYAPELVSDWNEGGFKALMLMVRQIRNNLFHGRKLELDEDQLQRNIRLTELARDITVTVLDHLSEAEAAAGLLE